ncbi:MAG TPA: hypothetical protein VJW20_08945 [Candidatus Angelobacter sp.]|nr:hypothetical protein [Candidatus Angelobacter sp.]
MGGGRSMGGGGFRGGGGFHASAPSGARGFAPSRSFAPRGTFAPRSFAPRSFAPRTFAPRTFAPRTFAPRPFAPRTFAPSGAHVFAHTSGGFVSFPGRTNGFVRFHNGFFFNNNRFFFHHRFFSRGCFGCFSPFFFNSGFFFGAPFFGGPFIGAPFWGDPFYSGYGGYSGYPADYYAPPPAPVAESSDNGSNAELAADVQQLSDEVADLRSENRDSYNRSESNSNSSISVKEPGQPAVFIFKDGRRVTAQNYAIAGETLWIMDEHAAHKFALSELDATATEHANAINGVDVRIPAAKP